MNEIDVSGLTTLLIEILEKNRISKHVREIALHTLLRIVRIEQYNGYFVRPSFLMRLIELAGNKILPATVNKTAVEILSILAKMPDINQFLATNDEFKKLNMRNPGAGPTRGQVVALPQIKFFTGLLNSISASTAAEQPILKANENFLPEVSKNGQINANKVRSNSVSREITPKRDQANTSFQGVDQEPRKRSVSRDNSPMKNNLSTVRPNDKILEEMKMDGNNKVRPQEYSNG